MRFLEARHKAAKPRAAKLAASLFLPDSSSMAMQRYPSPTPPESAMRLAPLLLASLLPTFAVLPAAAQSTEPTLAERLGPTAAVRAR